MTSALRRRIGLIGVIVCSAGLAAPALGQRSGGKTVYSYALVDLLGFPDRGYQSQGQFITNRNAQGQVLIYGTSRLFLESGQAVFHPAMWTVQLDNTFANGDPQDRGLPPSAREVSATGFSRAGVAVCNPVLLVEKDENGDWIIPAYVNLASGGFVELPGPYSRNQTVSDINDSGVILGTYVDVAIDPTGADGLESYAATWQLNANGSIAGPFALPVVPGEFAPSAVNSHGVILGRYFGYPALAWYVGAELQWEVLDSSLQYLGADPTASNDHPPGDPRLAVTLTTSLDATGAGINSDQSFIWRPWNETSLLPLGTLGGPSCIALDVNRNGDVVGWSDTKRAGQRAFLYRSGKLIDLNTQANVGSRTLQFALGINDSGDIVGFMDLPRPVNEQRGFLLRPN